MIQWSQLMCRDQSCDVETVDLVLVGPRKEDIESEISDLFPIAREWLRYHFPQNQWPPALVGIPVVYGQIFSRHVLHTIVQIFQHCQIRLSIWTGREALDC